MVLVGMFDKVVCWPQDVATSVIRLKQIRFDRTALSCPSVSLQFRFCGSKFENTNKNWDHFGHSADYSFCGKFPGHFQSDTCHPNSVLWVLEIISQWSIFRKKMTRESVCYDGKLQKIICETPSSLRRSVEGNYSCFTSDCLFRHPSMTFYCSSDCMQLQYESLIVPFTWMR